MGQCTLISMRWVVHADEDGGGRLASLAEAPSGTESMPESTAESTSAAAEVGEVRAVLDLVAAIGEIEAASSPRWVWVDTGRVYPDLLRAGVRVARCHDVVLVDEILAARADRKSVV